MPTYILLRKYLKKKIYNALLFSFFSKAPLNNSPFGAMINLDFMSFEKNIIGKLKSIKNLLHISNQVLIH